MKRETGKVEVLVASTGVSSEEELPEVAHELSQAKCQALLINQIGDKPDWKSPWPSLRVMHFPESGVSKSRNRALENSIGDYLLIADEDVSMTSSFSEIIQNAFEKYPEADIITFKSQNEKGQSRKSYPDQSFWHDSRSLLKVSSIEIAIRRESLLANPVDFDENFGLGSRFATGEESIFLNDAYEKGYKILFVPEYIVSHPDLSSGRKLDRNKPLMKAKGAMFSRMYGWKAYGVCLLFALKKRKESGFSMLQNVKLLYEGIASFKSLQNES